VLFNGTGVTVDRLLSGGLLVQMALPALGRFCSSADLSGLVVAGCASITSVLCSLHEHRRVAFLLTVFVLATVVLAASFLVGAAQAGLVVVICASFPALVMYDLVIDQPAPTPQHANTNVRRRRSFDAVLLQRAWNWLLAVATMSGIFVVSLLLVTGGGWLWRACATA